MVILWALILYLIGLMGAVWVGISWLSFLTELIAFGTIGFWILMVLEFGFILYCLDNADDDTVWAGWSTLSLALVLSILWLATGWNPVRYVIENPLLMGLSCAAYVLMGLGWSVGKWWFFNKNRKEKVDELRVQFLRREKIEGDKVPDEKLLDWSAYFQSEASSHRPRSVRTLSDARPEVKDYKDQLIAWTAFWPVSFIWTMINDPFVKFFNWLYKMMRSVYQRVTDRMFAGLDQEVEAVEKARRLREAEDRLDPSSERGTSSRRPVRQW